MTDNRIVRIPARRPHLKLIAERPDLYELFNAAHAPRGKVASAPAPDGRAATKARRSFFYLLCDTLAGFIADVIERPATAVVCIIIGMLAVIVPAIVIAGAGL